MTKLKAAMPVLRTLVALLGAVYIISSVSFRDTIVLPAGTRLPDGQALERATTLPIGSLDLARLEAGQPVKVKVLAQDSGAVELTLSQVDGVSEAAFSANRGIVTTIRQARPRWLISAFLMLAPVYLISTARWWLLLRARDVSMSKSRALRLVMAGAFVNYLMPGMTGGDFFRAYYAAKSSRRRADAATSVFVDRGFGLFGLAVLAGFSCLFVVSNPTVRLASIYVWIGVFGVVLAVGAYMSPRVRRALDLGRLVDRIPGSVYMKRIDSAVLEYRRHKGVVLAALLLTAIAHLLGVASAALAGYALGMDIPVAQLFVAIPIMMLTGAIPISYQGLGTMEFVGLALLVDPPFCTPNQVIGMLMTFRVMGLIYGLAGGLAFLGSDLHLAPKAHADDALPGGLREQV